jgi:hypothetical protein
MTMPPNMLHKRASRSKGVENIMSKSAKRKSEKSLGDFASGTRRSQAPSKKSREVPALW